LNKTGASMYAIFAGYLAGISAMTLRASIWGRFWDWDGFVFFGVFVGATVLGIWLFFFFPVYSLSNKTDFIWRWPWNVVLGILSGTLSMGAIWWDIVKQNPWILLIPIVIMTVAFLYGSYFKRKYEHTDSTLHPMLGRGFLTVALLLLLATNLLHAKYLGEIREEKKRVTWSFIEPTEQNPTKNRIEFRTRARNFSYTTVGSSNLKRYLESLDSEEVVITIEVTYNYGKRRSYSFYGKVDGLREWEAALK